MKIIWQDKTTGSSIKFPKLVELETIVVMVSLQKNGIILSEIFLACVIFMHTVTVICRSELLKNSIKLEPNSY